MAGSNGYPSLVNDLANSKRLPATVPAVKTGMVLKLDKIAGTSESVLTGVLKPGGVAYDQQYERTKVSYVNTGRSKLNIKTLPPPAAGKAARPESLSVGAEQRVEIKPNQKHSLDNSGKISNKFTVRFEPTWNADRSFYEFGKKRFSGNSVWFELKKSPDDNESRVKYMVYGIGSAGAAGSVAALEPGIQGFTEYNSTDKRVFTCLAGQGTIVLNGKPQKFGKGDKLTVNPNDRIQLVNDSKAIWLVDRRPADKKNFRPENLFYEVSRGKFVPASDVWFEVVLPK